MSASLVLAVPSGPFIDLTTGNVTPAWRQFLVTLAARTGGAQGLPTPDVAPIEAALVLERSARQAGDTSAATGIASEANARQAADATLALQINQRVSKTGDTMLGPLTTQRLGVNGAVPVPRQTVTGSKAANAALASLLDALELYGLISDTTT